jgi:hypothetical protein
MATHGAHGGKTGREPESGAGTRGLHWPGAVTPRSMTQPLDYALLEGAFLTCFTGVVVLARKREGRDALAIAPTELPVMAMAVFALADVLAKEKVSTWIREPFVVESIDHRPGMPQGSGVRYAIGEMLTCTRCVGTWSALGLVGLRTVSPIAGRAANVILALTGANDILQSGFRLLVERANRAILETDVARRTEANDRLGQEPR